MKSLLCLVGLVSTCIGGCSVEYLSGTEFEPLCSPIPFAVAGLTLLGSARGRDLIGIRPFDDRPDERTVIQCFNRSSLTQAKAEKDMTAAVNGVTDRPDAFKFVCRNKLVPATN